MVEDIRDIAEQDTDVIRQQIDETRSSLTAKLEAFEDQVVGTVQGARESMEETIESVKDSVQETICTVKQSVQETVSSVKETFDIPLQVRRHPWPMVGGSLIAGLVAGLMLGNSRRRQRMPMDRLSSHGQPMLEPARPPVQASNGHAAEPHEPGVMDQFREEIDAVKGLAIGLAMGLVRDVIKENVPQLSDQLGEVVDNITTKLGGQPVRGPVLQENPFRSYSQNR